MGKPSDDRGQKRRAAALRAELQKNIEEGECAYCRAPARPGEPLTREHVIPRARGGRRKDVRIIVPACAHCNHRRGCTDLIPFLLRRPQRISAFLDYLGSLSQESVNQLDKRVLAEAYATVAILVEAGDPGDDWKERLSRLTSGRALHRRRYAARRAMSAVGDRLDSRRTEGDSVVGPSCPVPTQTDNVHPLHLEEPLEKLAARVISLLALFWHSPADVVQREMRHAVHNVTGRWIGEENSPESVTGSLHLDGWTPKPKRKRSRVDRRRGRAMRPQRVAAARGRAA